MQRLSIVVGNYQLQSRSLLCWHLWICDSWDWARKKRRR